MAKDLIKIEVPRWVSEYSAEFCESCDMDTQMDFAIELSRLNIDKGTGGPFGAGIFEIETGKLIAAGVNLVTGENCSTAHAEVVALMLAQTRLNLWDLSQAGAIRIVSSSEPCAMCLGSIYWSGVKSVVYAAGDIDVRNAGFDEGIKPDSWQEKFRESGFEVISEIKRDISRAVLEEYRCRGGQIYNPGRA